MTTPKVPTCNCWKDEKKRLSRENEIAEIGKLTMDVFWAGYDASSLCVDAGPHLAAQTLVGLLYAVAMYRIDKDNPSKQVRGEQCMHHMELMFDEVVTMARHHMQHVKTRSFTAGSA